LIRVPEDTQPLPIATPGEVGLDGTLLQRALTDLPPQSEHNMRSTGLTTPDEKNAYISANEAAAYGGIPACVRVPTWAAAGTSTTFSSFPSAAPRIRA
jgi:hypothetical protein